MSVGSWRLAPPVGQWLALVTLSHLLVGGRQSAVGAKLVTNHVASQQASQQASQHAKRHNQKKF